MTNQALALIADEHLTEEVERLRGVLEVEEAALRLMISVILQVGRRRGRLETDLLPGCPSLDADAREWSDYLIKRGAMTLSARGLNA